MRNLILGKRPSKLWKISVIKIVERCLELTERWEWHAMLWGLDISPSALLINLALASGVILNKRIEQLSCLFIILLTGQPD
ncbi:hypothetical protein OPQ81_003102 [Rhizoctonia solani]|nr:hypothetical protein OPQ81_003102 [Rhizoctonia solani]